MFDLNVKIIPNRAILGGSTEKRKKGSFYTGGDIIVVGRFVVGFVGWGRCWFRFFCQTGAVGVSDLCFLLFDLLRKMRFWCTGSLMLSFPVTAFPFKVESALSG